MRLVVEVGARHVQELLRLLDDGRDDVRVGMAGRRHRDASGAVEEHVAVDILDERAFPARYHERVVARVGGRDDLRVTLDERLRPRTR